MKTNLPGLSLLRLCFFVVLIAPLSATSQNIDYGKTYFNVTKGVTGGTVEPNDILEIRATFVVKGTEVADSCAFRDIVPLGTTYVANSLSVLTNEAKIYKSFTDLPTDDCGKYVAPNITINLGFNPADRPATAFRRGRVKSTDRPSFYGSTCIMIAAYRVRVTAGYGTTINVGGGSATYKVGSAPLQTITFNTNRITIWQNSGICSNSVGGNTLGAEFNGTFGGGPTRNRGTSTSVPGSYNYQLFTSGGPQDYNYGIANNTSILTNYTTSNAWPKPDIAPSHRVFNVWDIIGDHTGALNQFMGNPAADTVINKNAGYMLVINASYKTDSAFQHTITNLCPNTYYEISAWFRNMCSKCGCDSTGRGATGGAGYIPTAPGDSSGVYPSLTFDVNGSDYYSTGLIKYTGQWIKKGFTYLTGPTQTSFVLTIKNNAPGGGGNDWALDDIAVSTCTPNLTMNPSPTVNVCYGNTVNMSCDVRCFFSNYTYYEWEKSTTGGATWASTGVSGVGTPVLVSGQWQYSATYPPFPADSQAHNARYRIKVASTLGNLSNGNCSFMASSMIQVYVNNCMQLLNLKLTSFQGWNDNEVARLSWTAENETVASSYDVERSTDGIHFVKVISISADAASAKGGYHYADPLTVSGVVYYRIRYSDGAQFKYSAISTINSNLLKFSMKSLVNPFANSLNFDVQSPSNRKVMINIFDPYGRMLKQKETQVSRGINKISINDLDLLPPGTYILRVEGEGQVLNERVIKATH